MGRIKTSPVKRITRRLIECYEDEFTDDFEKNKEKVRELVDCSSKRLVNMIAGYITRIKRNPGMMMQFMSKESYER